MVTTLAHEVHGTGEPLVLVHGITHRRQAWYPLLEHLTDHRQVILFDLPGHGESPDLVVENGDVQATIRERMKDLFDELGLDRPHIGGNSLGGRIALEAGADELVRSVTTLSPAAYWSGARDFFYIRSVFFWLTTSARLMAPVVPLLARSDFARALMGGMIQAHPSRVPVEALIGDVAGMRRAIPAMRQIFPAAEVFHREIPEDIPVTIAWGTKDRILRRHQAEMARQRLPQARHIWLPDCGHVPMWDDPELIAQVLLDGSAAASQPENKAS